MSDIPINLTGNLTPDEQYLWDATGTPDPMTARIEAALRPLRFSGRPLALESMTIRTRIWSRVLVAAVVALIGAAVYLMLPHRGQTPLPPAARQTWQIASLTKSSPIIGEPKQFKSTMTERSVQTDAATRAALSCQTATTVEMNENTRVRLLDSDDKSPWATLEYGSLNVKVAANDQPVHFGVLGEKITVKPGTAAYIDLNEKIGANVKCDSGQLAIDWEQKQTRLAGPAGCSVAADSGPSVPVQGLSSAEFCKSVSEFDAALLFPTKDPKLAYKQLEDVLAHATPKDAPTLWNLLSRVKGDQRVQVRNILRKLIKAPQGIDPDAILKLEPKAMDAWWTAAVEAAK